MLNVKQSAGTAPVDNLVERVRLGGVRSGVERNVFGGEGVLGGGTVATSLIADVLIGKASVLLERRGVVVRGTSGRGGIECGGGGA